MMATATERSATHTIRYRATYFRADVGQFGAHVEIEVVRGKNAETGESWHIGQTETGRIFPLTSGSKSAERKAWNEMADAIGAWNQDRANTGPFPVSRG